MTTLTNVITAEDNANLDIVDSCLTYASDAYREEKARGQSMQAALRDLAVGRDPVELMQILGTLKTVKALQDNPPVKPADPYYPVGATEEEIAVIDEKYAADMATWEDQRAERKYVDNKVRGMLRGFKPDGYALYWRDASIQFKLVAPEPAPVATPEEIGAPDQATAEECIAGIAAEQDAQHSTDALDSPEPTAAEIAAAEIAEDPEMDAIVKELRAAAADTAVPLESELPLVQQVARMSRKERQAFVTAVNEHSNETTGYLRIV